MIIIPTLEFSPCRNSRDRNSGPNSYSRVIVSTHMRVCNRWAIGHNVFQRCWNPREITKIRLLSSPSFYAFRPIYLFCICVFTVRVIEDGVNSSQDFIHVKFYIRANDSQFTPTDLAVFVHLSHFKTTARHPIQVINHRGRVPIGQESSIIGFAVACVEYCRWNVGLEAQWNFIYGETTVSSHRRI